MRFSAIGLPAGLTLDPETGVIRGTVADRAARTHAITFVAANARGRAERPFRLVVGDTLALTPPMGWNDWYTFYERPSDALMRKAADIMIASGMADHGYQFVNIDDAWMMKPRTENPDEQGPPRDARGMINANRRFPDMKAMTDYIHGLGLKAGIYTSPGALTCAGYHASWAHEEQDAARFVEWGFDFLKYDWCSYSETPRPRPDPEMNRRQRPYRLMGDILRRQPRDIVFNLCQYGMGEVWKWGAEVGGHSWRTTGDLGLEKGARLPGFYSIGLKNAELAQYAGPGRWNDPDYILIGYVGNAHNIEEPAKPTTLTHHEQYSYMSMWALMAAPLFYSGDITRLDDFTLNVLNNAEVIAVDQDALGRQAAIVRRTEDEFILAKPLEDGSLAVGLFNLSEAPRTMSVSTAELGRNGRQRVRDLWRWKDVGTIDGRYEATVGRHGVMLVRMWPEATSTAAAPSFQVLGTTTISRDAASYHGWPTVARLKDGRLIAASSGGREEHICPFGRVDLYTSADDGTTWAGPRTILDTDIDDRDAGVLETSKGTWLVTTFTSLAYEPILIKAEGSGTWEAAKLRRWQAARDRLSAPQRQAELGQFLVRSTDGGRSWSSRIDTIVNSPHGPIQLKDGRLLYAGKELWTGERRNGVAESADDGLTWRWLAPIPARPGDDPAQYHEFHAVECASGRLVVQIRNHNPSESRETLQSESADGGRSWSVPHPIGVWGLPSHLLRLKDGRLLMTYGYRRAPFGNQARVSRDEGRTWSEPIVLSADGASTDLGYPSTVELGDGTLLTVWYEVLRGNPRAVLRQARWRIGS